MTSGYFYQIPTDLEYTLNPDLLTASFFNINFMVNIDLITRYANDIAKATGTVELVDRLMDFIKRNQNEFSKEAKVLMKRYKESVRKIGKDARYSTGKLEKVVFAELSNICGNSCKKQLTKVAVKIMIELGYTYYKNNPNRFKQMTENRNKKLKKGAVDEKSSNQPVSEIPAVHVDEKPVNQPANPVDCEIPAVHVDDQAVAKVISENEVKEDNSQNDKGNSAMEEEVDENQNQIDNKLEENQQIEKDPLDLRNTFPDVNNGITDSFYNPDIISQIIRSYFSNDVTSPQYNNYWTTIPSCTLDMILNQNNNPIYNPEVFINPVVSLQPAPDKLAIVEEREENQNQIENKLEDIQQIKEDLTNLSNTFPDVNNGNNDNSYNTGDNPDENSQIIRRYFSNDITLPQDNNNMIAFPLFTFNMISNQNGNPNCYPEDFNNPDDFLQPAPNISDIEEEIEENHDEDEYEEINNRQEAISFHSTTLSEIYNNVSSVESYGFVY